jgi:hypothetical protein
MDKPGHWLLSVEAPTELPAGGGVFYGPEDVVRFDGATFSMLFDGSAQGVPPGSNVDGVALLGSDPGDLLLSFDVPTTLAAVTYDPADVVRFSGGTFSLYFDASAAGAGVALSDNATAMDEAGGLPVLGFDVPADLSPSTGPPTYVAGQIAEWNGLTYNLFETLPAWPSSSEVAALSCQANPGRVYDRVVYPKLISLNKSTATPGSLVVQWTASCSAGAEDYGIYEGKLGSWYSHKQKTCTDTGSDLTEEIAPQAGDSYYLVVPHNVAEEGAYGKDYVPQNVPPEQERPRPVAPADRCAVTHTVTPCPP